ncbi:MAG: hypothetical protein COA99_06815 [Moraxellaceae bacterium]|nr:MAG: hypothetical protein COA99_06815 [Moraxellaceae bacterium]
MTTRYFLSFPASVPLAHEIEALLELQIHSPTEKVVPHVERLMELFVPTFLKGALTDVGDAAMLSPRANKVIASAVATIAKTVSFMLGKMIKKRSNEELAELIEFIGDTYISSGQCSSGVTSIGCDIGEDLFVNLKRLMGEVRKGNLEEVREEQGEVMIQIVNKYIDNMMQNMIDTLSVNFVVKKICNAAVATCRGAGHMVVNRVFKGMDEEAMINVVDFFEDRLVTAG